MTGGKSTRDCAVGTFALQRADLTQQDIQLGKQRRAGFFHCGVARHHQDVHVRKIGADTTKRLTRQALDPVTVDRALGTALGDGQAEPGRVDVVVSEAHKKTAAAEATADSSQSCEVGGAA